MRQDSGSIRCFAAMYPDAEALDAIATVLNRLRSSEPRVRWEKLAQVHITAKFIGDIGPETAARISDGIRAALGGSPQVQTRIDATGVFPHARAPRIVWLGFRTPQPGILAAVSAVEDICAAEGIDREKKQFTPHMTIGRVKDPSIAADLQEALRSCSFEAIPVTFRAVRVMRSTLTPSGAIHQEIGRADLLSD